jgi:plastocyanin
MSSDMSSRPDLTGEFRVRFPLPVVLPLAAILAIGAAAFGFSRVLLNIPKEAATAVALVTAANILIACAFVSLRSRMHRVGVLEVALIALYPIVVAVLIGYTGIGTEAAAGPAEAAQEESSSAPSAGSADATLVAQNVSFDTDSIKLPADRDVTVVLDNQDSVAHDFALYKSEADADSQSNSIFTSDTVDPGTSAENSFKSPAAGDYVFQCNIHPTMRGTATVG